MKENVIAPRNPKIIAQWMVTASRNQLYTKHILPQKKKTLTYTEMTKNIFKERFNDHNATIKKRPKKEKITTLSEYVWKLKDQKTPFTIKCLIMAKAHATFALQKNDHPII